jgi:multidrug resistance efflux pump
VKLQNVDLEVERARLSGEAAAALERLTSVRASLLDGQRLEEAERARLAGEEAQLRQQLISLKLQLTLFETRLAQLNIKSPIEGEVTTWDVRNLLANRPVQPGQLLLTVARTDADWELLVRMPEVRMGHVLDAWRESKGEPLPVTIMLASEPGKKYQGRLVEFHDRAEEDPQEGSTVLLKVLFDKSQLQHPRSGAAALVKVHCGRRSLGYVWFHDIWEFFESRVFF